MSKKILLVALSTNFGKSIAEIVANKIGKYFLSIDDFIEYSLFNSGELLKKCGKEYYLKREQDALSDCLGYENMLYSCSYDVFVNNLDKFQDFKMIYLYLPKEKLAEFKDSDLTINQIAFEDRNKFLESLAIKIDYKTKIDEIVMNVVKTIKE